MGSCNIRLFPIILKDVVYMSGSQKNKNFDNSKSGGLPGKPKKKLDDKAKFRRNSKVVIIVIALVIALSLAIKSNAQYNTFAAVKVDGYSFSAAEYSYQYSTLLYQTYNNIMTYYGESASSLLDPNKPLDQQKYSDKQSWADYFKETTLSNLQQTAILCNAAKSANFKQPDSVKKEIDTIIDGYKSTYKNNGYPTLNAFLEANFGKGVTESVMRKSLENAYLASNYKKELDKKTYSAAELDDYYAKNKDSLDAITYRAYHVDAVADNADGTISEQAIAASKTTADKIAAAKSETEFTNLVYQNAPTDKKSTYESPSATLNNAQRASSFSTYFKDWLLDSSRKQGDTTSIKTDKGSFALYYISRSDNRYNMKKVRHILISVEDFTDKTKADAALKTANDLLNTWKSGEKTDASFAALAATNSADNADQGGYYEFARGQMVPEFENWSYDPSRKAGDTGIVKTEYGYHIMYFIGDGELYRNNLATQEKRTAEYTSWYDGQKNTYPVNQTFFMRFAKQK